jgi:FtsP/CotA-like multicopper oxidase with cupredoxin domain
MVDAMSNSAARSRGWLRRIGRSPVAHGLSAGMILAFASWVGSSSFAQKSQAGLTACQRPEPGSAVREPQDLRSHDGVLQVDLALYNQQEPDGSIRYCYLTPDGSVSPTLRLKPGDLLILHFKNDLIDFGTAASGAGHTHSQAGPTGPLCVTKKVSDPCTSGAMTPISSNLHFHGLTVPPVCHQDDVLKTSIQPYDPPFEYRLRIPADEPPGLYWYHPHIHGYSKVQVLGGASGALIIEGIERADPVVAGLPERVLVIRDQELLNPDAPPSKSEPVVPKNLVDQDGDSANNGTGFGKPAKDLSINFVPVPYPDYPPASITMKPGERQLWRVVNASAITYLNLAVLFGRAPQQLGIVAIDGVPITFNGSPAPPVEWVNHIGVPPGARVEFIVNGPPLGVPALLVTRTVDTGPGGENDPNRALATIVAANDAPEPAAKLLSNPEPLPKPERSWIGSVAPVRVRKLYFSEKLENPNDPTSATAFYLTVDGQKPVAFDPNSDVPDIVVRQGDVEDWIIENRSAELHDFHIHQLHFQLLDWNGVPVNEPFLRDTVNVPYYNGRMLEYPSVRLRMDFRDPHIVGTFVYHCHVLEHEDGGMMGRIRVLPAHTASSTEPSHQQN